MSGTREGGLKAVATIKQKHGDDFYKEIGRKGGTNGHCGGFKSNPELASTAGKKGGAKSKRGPKLDKLFNSKLQDVLHCRAELGLDFLAISRRLDLPYCSFLRWCKKNNIK